MTGSPHLREATLDDLGSLEALENSVFPGDRLSRRSLRYYIGSDTASFLVLHCAPRILGDAIVAFRRGSRVARLYSLAVHSDLAGRGYGRRLLSACEAVARERERAVLRLEVREDNSAAIRLYETAGFERFGHYQDYYEDGAAALRFVKVIT